MHHPLYWTQRYIIYKVTTKEKKKIGIALNSLQLNLLFMRSDPQSNQRYETDPINYINTWMRAFVCLKLFSLWDMKNEEVTQRLPFSSMTEKRKIILTSPCFFPFFLYFLQSDLGVVLQKYDLYIRSYIAQTTFFHQYQRELTYWRESNPGLPPGKWEFYHWTTHAFLRQSLP